MRKPSRRDIGSSALGMRCLFRKEKQNIHFEGQAIELENPVPLGGISAASTRAPKYTTLQKLLTAGEYKDL